MSSYKVMSFIIVAVFYCLFSSVYNIFADELHLITGEISEGKILDTIGCEIKFLRNEYTSTWKKSRLKKIIWNNDTISYVGYACNEKPISIVKYENTSEYRLLELLNNSQKTERAINENVKIAFLNAPLAGDCTEEEFSYVQSLIIYLFSFKASVSHLAPAELLNEINSTQHKFDYAFITKKYHNKTESFESEYMFGGPKYVANLKKMVSTLSEFVIFDIKKKIIVFQKNINENRIVWGLNSNTIEGQLIPPDLKEKMAKKQAGRRLKNNARSIRNQMETVISDYLGL